MTDPTRSDDPTATDTDRVFDQEQQGHLSQEQAAAQAQGLDPAAGTPTEDAGGPARGSGEADDDQAPVDQDDPELSGADLPEDQADGQGPTVEPGA
ncbi:hypothetical protein [Arsenicicoccus dermatophilus]|uniref:hypothetical protein n=1 Tax=Arsenicicoccus dermatophilus TaxID=1076331 RepID=UPI001F4D0BDF|nr:hypothetical protein [Arsenicicoccus dermatophilus]MCH8612301.1 hypothetical protein [Arsenicicoccus dermatophilus]